MKLHTSFFNEKSHPFNLALMRIVLFTALLFLPRYYSLEQLHYLPLANQTKLFAYYFLCSLGILGLATRIISWFFAVFGVYLLASHFQFTENTGFYPLVFWVLMVFSASRNEDYFSVDAIFAAIRKADQGDTNPPIPSTSYALPIRFAWLYMGAMYLLDGIQKKTIGGGQISEFFVCAYECIFLFLVIFAPLRPFLFLSGFLIYPIQSFALVLLDSHKALSWLGSKIFPSLAYVIYDGGCKLCRRTVGIIRRFDIGERIKYVTVEQSRNVLEIQKFNLSEEELLRDMHVVCGEKALKGFDSYRLIASRIPIFWIVWPFLYFSPIASAGKHIYRTVADGRTCEIKAESEKEIKQIDQNLGWQMAWGWIVSIALMIWLFS